MFGGRYGVDEAVAAAVDLWQRRFFRHAIVSGGATQGIARTECSVIKDGMVKGGVPAELILEEHRATNTGENVLFSLPVIDAALGRHNIASVICLGKICTARRYPMTLHRHWPEVDKMLVTINPFAAPVERWHTDPEFRDARAGGMAQDRALPGKGLHRRLAVRSAHRWGRATPVARHALPDREPPARS